MISHTSSDLKIEEMTKPQWPQISDKHCKELQVLNKAMFKDLMDAWNYAFYELLEERNALLQEW